MKKNAAKNNIPKSVSYDVVSLVRTDATYKISALASALTRLNIFSLTVHRDPLDRAIRSALGGLLI